MCLKVCSVTVHHLRWKLNTCKSHNRKHAGLPLVAVYGKWDSDISGRCPCCTWNALRAWPTHCWKEPLIIPWSEQTNWFCNWPWWTEGCVLLLTMPALVYWMWSHPRKPPVLAWVWDRCGPKPLSTLSTVQISKHFYRNIKNKLWICCPGTLQSVFTNFWRRFVKSSRDFGHGLMTGEIKLFSKMGEWCDFGHMVPW